MTERDDPPVGGLGEEAVRLLKALQDWTRDSSGGAAMPTGGLLTDLDEHIATDGKDCQYCPVCHLIAAVRTTSPEVKHHLSVAASSLLQAAAHVLTASPTGRGTDKDPVERIDLDGDVWEDEDQ